MSKNKKICTLTLPTEFELRQGIRKTWGFRPVSRVVESKKVYSRKKFSLKDYEY